MQLDLPRRLRRNAVGLTPLIDVVFILLLFFMLASSLTPLHALPVRLGGEVADAGAAADEERDLLRLRIFGDGSLDLDGTALTLDELHSALSMRLHDRSETRLELLPADDVDLQRLLLVLDEAAAAGLPLLRLR
jgi:biopolymer transport protein ExbD